MPDFRFLTCVGFMSPPPSTNHNPNLFHARHLKARVSGILAHCHYPLHTSLLEGINNKIKVLKRMAYGYRDDGYFFLKIMDAFPGVPGVTG